MKKLIKKLKIAFKKKGMENMYVKRTDRGCTLLVDYIPKEVINILAQTKNGVILISENDMIEITIEEKKNEDSK